MKRITAFLIVGSLALAGSAQARHGADDPVGHVRHGADDVQPHKHKRHHHHHHHHHRHGADDPAGHR
jgi:hypothetical protein